MRGKLVLDLESKLSGSPSTLIGNSGYKKYLIVRRGAVVLDQKKGEEDSRFEGNFILIPNTKLDAGEIATTHKNLYQLEQAFWGLKDIFYIGYYLHNANMR
ncbi:MAG: hypothetical protein ABIK98_12430 [Pseudomonadota bacterium]